MAIALDAVSNPAAASTGTTLTWSHTVGAALSNGVLIVGFFSTFTDIPDSVTYGGVAMTQIPGSPGNTGSGTPVFYILLNPAAGAHNVVVTDSSNGGSMTGYAASYSGVKQSTSVDAVAAGTFGASAGAAATPLTTVAVGAWIISGAFTRATSPTIVAGSGLTSRAGPLAASAQYAVRFADSAGTVATGAHSVAWTAGGSAFQEWSVDAFSLAPSTSSTAALAGSIAGSAAVAGALTLPGRAALVGAIAGTSSAAAQLAGVAILSGSIAGTSASSGALTLPGRAALAGAIAGTSTSSGALTTTATLAGAIAGAASVTGALSALAGLSGTVAGTSSSSGALRLAAGFAATVAGHATATGKLTTRAALVGAIAGSSSAAASLTIDAGGPLPVLVEFRGTYIDSTGTPQLSLWQTITCDVFGLGWKRGSHEYRGVFGIPDAAAADLYLYDPALDLDPGNTAGSWYGLIDVGAEIRISMGLVDFYGRITDIAHDLEPAPWAGAAPMPVAHLSALDPQGRVSGVDLPVGSGSFYPVDETTNARIARIVAYAQVPGSHRIATGGRLLLGSGVEWPATDAWSMIVDVVQNELGSLEWFPTPTYSQLVTHTRETTWPDTPPATVLDLGCHAGAIPIWSAKVSTPINNIRNQVFAARALTDTTPTEWDGPSQPEYGLRPMTKSDLQLHDAADRDAWATFVLAHNAYPLQTWTLETRPTRADQVFAIEATPLYVGWAHVTIDGYGPVIDRSMRVLGVSWSIDANAAGVCEITVGWDLPVPPLVPVE